MWSNRAIKQGGDSPHLISLKPITILIADDHFVVREGLTAVINRRTDMIVVAEASSGQEAVKLFLKHRPDLTLMDLRMKDMDGLEAIRRIRAESPNARIIVLTTFDGDEEIYRALTAGARAYLLKDVPREELLKTIRNVHAGHKCLPVSVAKKLAGRLTAVALTPAEQKVLELMVRGNRNREIAQELDVAEGTVKSHVNSLFTKLGVTTRTAAVTTALSRGLVHL